MKNSRLQALTAGGFLLLMVLSPLRSATSAAARTPSSKPEAQEHKPKARVRGARDMADGQIKDVTCKGRAMDLVFDDSHEILHLHTDNYFKIEFSAINFTPQGTMNPCKQAKGMYARVYYYHIKGHPHEGDLTAVQLRK